MLKDFVRVYCLYVLVLDSFIVIYKFLRSLSYCLMFPQVQNTAYKKLDSVPYRQFKVTLASREIFNFLLVEVLLLFKLSDWM